MLKLLTSPSCTSCRKARVWLVDHDIDFKERNIIADPLNVIEIRNILAMTENGTEDLISTRSRAFSSLDINLENLNLKQLLELLVINPTLIRRPLIINKSHLQIGYNEDEIRCFLPRGVRRLELIKAQIMAGLI
ncbi:MAG: transcriptional regulator Spx [Lactobacillales bacterium]|jgi:regulatory protein spx|nr:transcriptional regulator Spx [Lactobacillales bacterium]